MKNSRRYEGQVFYDNNINEDQYDQIESNLRNECYTALVYDGMIGIGDGDVYDCIPDYLGLNNSKVIDPKFDMTDLGEDYGNVITDLFNIINSITFCCDEDGDVNRVVLEFDRESIIREIRETYSDLDLTDKFNNLRFTYKVSGIEEGHEIPRSNYEFAEY